MIRDIKLPVRLETALSFTEGAVLADIGTDHAYLPVAACLTGRAERAVACDVNPGPLARADENIRRYGLEGRIETRLGYGLKPVAAGEADCAVIAGVGGMMIIDILSQSPETARSFKKLILQPQHDSPRLRKFLHEASYLIADEELILDSGKYYFLMTAVPLADDGRAGMERWNELEYFYGKHILEKGKAVLDEFLKNETEKLNGYLKNGETNALLIRKELNQAARDFETKM